MSIPDHFRLQIFIYVFSKHTGQHMLPLLTIFNVPIDGVCRKFRKNAKNIENWNILWFMSFSVSICDIFTEKTAINSLEEPIGQHILSLLTLFNVPIHKVPKKFVIFGVNLRFFSLGKQQLFFRECLLDNVFLPC